MRITNPNFVAATAVRLAKKTFRFKTGYGDTPIFRDEDLPDSLDELKYKRFRFAATCESCSPLMDKNHEIFITHAIGDGRRDLGYWLMHKTFYEIKCIQRQKLRKEKKQLALGEVEEEIITDPMLILHKAQENSQPTVVVRKVKRGGAIYQVPYPLGATESGWFARKWLFDTVAERPKPRTKHFPEVMARELIDAAYDRGKVVKKKDDIHRLAAANKAYAHYRWG